MQVREWTDEANRAQLEGAAKHRAVRAHDDLLAIARMAADGTYIPPQHAREVLERHGLVPGKDER